MIQFESVFSAIGHTLWAVSWQVCILAAIVLIAERFFRNAPPSFRYFLWLLVIIRLAVPFDIPLPTPAGDFVNWHILLDFSPTDTGAVPPSLSVLHQAAAPIDPFRVAGLLWLLGFVSFMLYLAARCIKTRRLLSETEPVSRPDLCDLLDRYASDLDIRKKIGLFASRDESFHAPAVIGVIRPRIILPHEIVSAWSAQDIEPILLHEIVHIRNRDLLVNWFQIILNGIYFFHPVIWLANIRIRKAREELCDDRSVARLHAERERYSRCMVRIGEEFLQERTLTFAEVSFTESGSSLGERIRRIMRENYTPHRRLTAISLVVLCVVMVFGIMLACNRSAVQSTNADKSKKTENLLQVYVLNDSTFRIGSKQVSRTDYARVMRQLLPRYNYGYYLNGSPDVSVETYKYAWTTAAAAGAGPHRIDPSIQKKLGETPKSLLVDILSDSTFEVAGKKVTQADLEQSLREKYQQSDYNTIIQRDGKTPQELTKFVTDTAIRAGAKSFSQTIRMDPNYKPSLVMGIIDETLFRFEGRHWIARADLEREFRQRLPLFQYRVVIFGKKDTPEKLITFVKNTAKRAGAKEITYEVSTAQFGLVRIHILDKTNFVINDKRVARADLDRTLKELLPQNQYHYTMSGYPDTPIETIQFVIDTAKSIGSKSVGFDPSLNQQMDTIMKRHSPQKSSQIIKPPTVELVVSRNDANKPANKRDIDLKIIKKGEYVIGGVPATSSDLEKVLKAELDKYVERNVIIHTGSRLPREDIIEVMDAAVRVGAKGMAFPTDDPSAEVVMKNVKMKEK